MVSKLYLSLFDMNTHFYDRLLIDISHHFIQVQHLPFNQAANSNQIILSYNFPEPPAGLSSLIHRAYLDKLTSP